MIILGYPGIGKTTLCGYDGNGYRCCIDLETSNFYDENGKRPDEWWKYYGNIAIDFSNHGFTVFTGMQKEVVGYIKEHHKGQTFLVFPSLELKDTWIEKLKLRAIKSGNNPKELRALNRTIEKYETDIENLKTLNLPYYEIRDMGYSLRNIVDILYDITIVERWDLSLNKPICAPTYARKTFDNYDVATFNMYFSRLGGKRDDEH